jgi:hypothetical protein
VQVDCRTSGWTRVLEDEILSFMLELCERCGEAAGPEGCACSISQEGARREEPVLDLAIDVPPRPSSAPKISFAPAAVPLKTTGSQTWEWTLANVSDPIRARVDFATSTESIYVGARLVSRSKLGDKPEGHAISASHVGEGYRHAMASLVALYNTMTQAFELRANGQLVTPSQTPPVVRARPVPLPPAPSYASGQSSILKMVGVLGGIAFAIGLVVFGVRAYVKSASAAAAPAGELTAKTKLVRLHYPAGFKPEKETAQGSDLTAGEFDDCPKKGKNRICHVETSVLIVHHATRDEGIFAFSLKSNGFRIGRDPWLVSNLMHQGFTEQLERELFHGKKATLAERDRKDLTCLGEPGAGVTATMTYEGQTGTFFTCTFFHEGNAFMIGYVVNDNVAADAPALEKMVEGIELLP